MSDRYKGAILSPTAPTVTPQSAGGIYTSSQQLQYQGQGVWPQAVNNPLTNSLRFRSSASAYLSRTPASAGNRRTFTFSAWAKIGGLDTRRIIFGTGDTSLDNSFEFEFYNDNKLRIANYVAGLQINLITTSVYRDPSAWYHLVMAVDTTQATDTNRVKLYVNGIQVTSFSTAIYPSQNFDTALNTTSATGIGRAGTYNDLYYNGYLAEMYFVDGVQLTPSSFGTTDAYGIWQPIPYTGAYGTNGFYLPMNIPASTYNVDYLVVGGGGAGGLAYAGGGGAGGYRTGTISLGQTVSYTITVGAGGTGGSGSYQAGGDGSSSIFSTITSAGGGGGGAANVSNGRSGGSGGGGSGITNNGTGGTGNTPSTSPSQGNNGGAGAAASTTSAWGGGGGGGASAVGGTGSTSIAGAGGAGTASSISGSSVTYAGGGGGGANVGYPGGAGGSGGGGAGGGDSPGTGSNNAANGTTNLGGGGGGGGGSGQGATNVTSGNDGSGVVILSIPTANYTGTTTGSPTVTTSGSNTILTYTSSGTYTA